MSNRRPIAIRAVPSDAGAASAMRPISMTTARPPAMRPISMTTARPPVKPIDAPRPVPPTPTPTPAMSRPQSAHIQVTRSHAARSLARPAVMNPTPNRRRP